MYVGIHIRSIHRPILDKTEICRQSAVKIVNVIQYFQDCPWNSTFSVQKNRQADGHNKTVACEDS